MHMNIVVQQIMGFFIAEDGKTAQIAVRSGPDTINFTFPTPDLDGVIDILTQARDAALAKGLPTDAQVQVRLPKSVAVSKAQDHVGAVLIYFDRTLQNRALGLFRDALCRKGFLGLGSKESLRFSACADAFADFVREERIYQKTDER